MNMRLYSLAAFTLAAACTVVALADPQGGGGRRNDRGPGGGGERGGGPGDRGGSGGWQGPGDWNSEQAKQFREQLEKFCEKHAPNRWADLKNTLGERNRQSRVAGMAFRFKGLQSMQVDDPKLYAIKVRQIEIEDEEYGLVKSLKEVEKTDAGKAVEIRAKLAEKSKEYIAQRLAERSHRIDRLCELVKKEQAKLVQDEMDKEKAAGDRVKEIVEQGTEFFTPKPPQFRGKGDGGGGGPGGGPGDGGGPNKGGSPPGNPPPGEPKV